MNRCFEEVKNFHSSFIGQTQAAQAHLLALQQVRYEKKKALNLSDNVFTCSTKYYLGTLFLRLLLEMGCYFMWSSEPCEGVAACSAKVVPSFLSYLRP